MGKTVRVAVLFVLLFVAVSAAADKAQSYEMYQAVAGDTLQSVAERFRVTVDAVCRLNEFPSDRVLKAGEAVAVPVESSSAPAAEGYANVPTAWVAVVAQTRAVIRRQPGSGKVLYRPPVGTPLVLAGEKGSYYAVLMIDSSTGWITKNSVRFQPLAPSTSRGVLSQSAVLRLAFRYLGMPYRLGGTLPYNTDCSLFVQSVFAALGLRLPRTAAEQFRVGQPVSAYDLQAGDRLYFVGKGGKVNHTGIYVSNGLFIHASSNRSMVAIDSLLSGYYWQRFIGAMR